MGPLLTTGLTVLGATIAIGLIAGRAPQGGRPVERGQASLVRTLAIILFAYAEGIGVLGIVVGLLAVTIGRIAPDTNRWLSIAPAFVGAILGLALAYRSAYAPNRQVRSVAITFIVALAILTAVVAYLSDLLSAIGSAPPPDLPFALAGVIAAVATVGMGWVGSAALPALVDAEQEPGRQLISQQIRRVLPYQLVAFVASGVAIAMVAITPR
jgi:F0F1-type ATP synthase membrane subunit c/vacuolar-type H+-ATPase subunit K